MDATVAMEGNGPKSGIPKIMDLVLASADCTAVDAVAATLMGFDPLNIEHLTKCADKGLGVCDLDKVEVIGPKLETLRTKFKPSGDNLVSMVEMALRRSRFGSIVFNTRIFDLCCSSAILWYYVWYHLGPGRRRRDQILRHPRYGPQWTAEEWSRDLG